VPLLRSLVANRTQSTITLSIPDGDEVKYVIDLEVRAASHKGLRGITCVGVIADEAAFWAVDDAANADAEILAAVRPSLATTRGQLLVISSPYARKGEVYNTHKRYYGVNGDPLILVAQGASRDFNPSLPQSIVDRAIERDPAAANAEYLGEFRSDLESFISREVVDASVIKGRHELPPMPGTRYLGFADPAGGSGGDSFTLCIAHMEGSRIVIDAIREHTSPFVPEAAVAELATTLKSYGISQISGDRWGGEWPRAAFRQHGVDYLVCERPKSVLYTDALLPAMNSHQVELLDHPRMIAQLLSLERRVARSGRDTVDHPPGAKDDVINCVAGAVALAQPREFASWGILEHYRREAEQVRASIIEPDFGFKLGAPAPPGTVRLRAPAGISQLYGITGAAYMVDGAGFVTVSQADAKALPPEVWVRVDESARELEVSS
jgi:hypothetical protein